jgi:hypothetical protein
MRKDELFEKSRKLIAILPKYNQTGVMDFGDMETKLSLVDVYRELYPGVKIDLTCVSCLSHCLNLVLSWYERTYPKYLQSIQQPLKAELEVLNANPVPVKDKKGSKGNKYLKSKENE